MSDNFEEFDDILNDDESLEEFDVLVLTDDETGEDVELVVIERIKHDGVNYLLVVESEELENEESAASIIKEIEEADGEFSYEIVDDDAEFEEASKLFGESDDYEIT